MKYSVSCFKFLTQNNDFGYGFLVFGLFSQVFGLFGLFFMLGLGLKLLKLSYWLPKGPNLIQILCHYREKTINSGDGFFSKRCRFQGRDVEEYDKDEYEDENADENEDEDEDQYCCNEDEEFDVMTLRKLLKKARAELKKERMAAATAAEEAMAVILRLQREKSCVEMEANQYRRMVEHKLEYDNEMIQSLEWIVMKHESEKSLLDDELRLCKERLELFTEGNDEMLIDKLCEEVGMSSSTIEGNDHNSVDDFRSVVSSSDMDY